MQIQVKYHPLFKALGLIFGILFLLISLVAIISNKNIDIPIAYFIAGVIWLGIYFYSKKYSYLEITDEYIKSGTKTMLISDIQRIKYDETTYTLKSDNKKLKINTNHFINKKEYQEINQYMLSLSEKLKVKS